MEEFEGTGRHDRSIGLKQAQVTFRLRNTGRQTSLNLSWFLGRKKNCRPAADYGLNRLFCSITRSLDAIPLQQHGSHFAQVQLNFFSRYVLRFFKCISSIFVQTCNYSCGGNVQFYLLCKCKLAKRVLLHWFWHVTHRCTASGCWHIFTLYRH